MRYEKPIVMDLSARARSATGQEPLACIDGWGASAPAVCNSGGAGGGLTGDDCLAGPSAGIFAPRAPLPLLNALAGPSQWGLTGVTSDPAPRSAPRAWRAASRTMLHSRRTRSIEACPTL
jgi:hypothetical protein